MSPKASLNRPQGHLSAKPLPAPLGSTWASGISSSCAQRALGDHRQSTITRAASVGPHGVSLEGLLLIDPIAMLGRALAMFLEDWAAQGTIAVPGGLRKSCCKAPVSSSSALPSSSPRNQDCFSTRVPGIPQALRGSGSPDKNLPARDKELCALSKLRCLG